MKKKKLFLNEPVQVKWYTTAEGKEYMSRRVFDSGLRNFTEHERKRWFKRGWKKDLERHRVRHRALGIPDKDFK